MIPPEFPKGFEVVEGVTHRRLILLDRDGTLIVEKDYLNDPAGVELIPGAAKCVAALREAGHKVVVVTNQSGVGRGYFSAEVVDRIHDRLMELLKVESGTTVDSIYICPHTPADECSCRKPQPGLLLQASEDLGISLADAIMVGDKPADLEAGRAAGARTVLVLTGYGRETRKHLTVQPDMILLSLAELCSSLDQL